MINVSQIRSLGVLEFNSQGVLFAGDNVLGAVVAFDLTQEREKEKDFEINVYRIDEHIASMLGSAKESVRVNDIAVHPISGEVYISVEYRKGDESFPVLLKVNAKNDLFALNLHTLKATVIILINVPDPNRYVALRGTAGAPTQKEVAKSKKSLRTLSIVAMEFHDGHLYVAGISNEEFCSILRRLPYPFNGEQSISNIEMYHIAHDKYESRAPIRAMTIKKINGIDQLVAAYTCSPIVLIPIDELKDGEKVKARTVGDMGNGQPIDMVPYKMNGQEMLFVTNNSRSPVVIPVDGLQETKAVCDSDFTRGAKLDLNPLMPYGSVGKPIMFSGASLRIALLNKNQFVSLNRDAESGSLDLETILTNLPFKLHNIIGDWDIPVLS